MLKKYYKETEDNFRRRSDRTGDSHASNAESRIRHLSLITTDVTQSCVRSPLALENKSVNCTDQPTLASPAELKTEIEKHTKLLNATKSSNENKRSEINSLRKERTLYDHVFRNIEYQILDEEKKLLCVLKKHQEMNVTIKESEENLANLLDTISKNTDENFYCTFKREQENYENNIKLAAKISQDTVLSNDLKTGLEQSKLDETKAVDKNLSELQRRISLIGVRSSNRQLQNNASPSATNLTNQTKCRILLLENLIQDFKYRTEENKFEEIVTLFANGDINTELFENFHKKEDEVL